MLKVLAVGAHPDDIELFCAGTLAHYVHQAAAVTLCVLTDGSLGSRTMRPERTASVREAEARRAADVLGAGLLWLGLPDGFLYDTRETREQVVDVLRQAQPDVIFAPHPDDYHPDHRAAAALVTAARLLAREPAVVTAHPATDRVPSLFYADTLLGAGAGTPDVRVDITATMSVKEAMLAEHVSQNDSRRQRKGSDFVDLTRQQAERRGHEAGVRYAEVFTCVRTHPVTSPGDLTPPGTGLTLPLCP
ncbi:PIG-L deacetylase family protein [Streptomyces sp. MA5143a]|uniref:PIG-L deacetylase family protein n=1 Tax=Streptomyces sp. MA5143a TaxID=2083010 RepID=UPI000D1993AE|nr:PIG-L family deacetylase [Streptomyces sp. MA5143a]SPE99692.1 bacillithiol biosynthesis deacetylase BshB1 [Streptomyces sp. MA5143a]